MTNSKYLVFARYVIRKSLICSSSLCLYKSCLRNATE